ncbi:hypothetical protein GOP47_0025869 [Adiantum capillus-veneris]|uniref:Peptidase A1 domain-containing protein n=1 Tax=Adiantum capillus-veneris TaxID=13818 RepID=A0A9D4U254_ADICA|nr:hypothetical protein GOP47_0025869 [Adiantum capillus-veneris]
MLTRLFWLAVVTIARSASASNLAGETEHPASEDRSYLAYVVAGDGQFLATLALGTPPSPFTAILDTGSTLLWRQCLPCQLCYPQSPLPTPYQCALQYDNKKLRSHQHKLTTHCNNSEIIVIFDPSQSCSYSTASCSDPACVSYPGSCSSDNGSCTYDIVYIAPLAYTRGVLSYDTLSLFCLSHPLHKQLVSIPQFAFGCSHSSKAPYNFVGAGGIVGLGRGPLSLPSQLNVTSFAYCLGSIHDTRSRTPLVLGAAARRLGWSAAAGTQSIQFIDAIDYAYVVEIQAISVGDRQLDVTSSSLGLNLTGLSASHYATAGIVFDSGTTFTHLPTPAFSALYSAFSNALSAPLASAHPRNLSLCYQSYPVAVPSLSFHFYGGASMHLPIANYIISIEGVFCLAFMESPDDLAILGNVQQQNYHVLYDLETNTISFKPAHCRSLQNPF